MAKKVAASSSQVELNVGDKAPVFNLTDQNGRRVRLMEFRGRPLVLYFYPKDDTPGCTLEACAFRDMSAEYAKAGAIVIGVSLGDKASHEKFATKYNLDFPLLVDPDAIISTAYGAYGEKKFLGRTFKGIRRITFIIDRHGRIAKIFPKVNPIGHARAVLQAVEALG